MRQTILFLFIAAMLSATGCQKETKPDNLPALFPITVTIHQEGKPVSGASVRLIPETQGMPWSCGAVTDANGDAVIRTSGEYTGAPEGSYKVLISKLETPQTSGTDLSNLNASASNTNSDSVNLIDLKYSQPKSTPFNLNVEKGSPQATFDVGPPVRTVITGPR